MPPDFVTGCPFPVTLLMSEDGFQNDSNQPLGRRSAGESFLHAYLLHSGNRTHHLVLPNRQGGAYFEKLARTADPHTDIRAVDFRQWARAARDTGTFHLPDPRLGRWAWKRMPLGDGIFSLMGIVHTLNTTAVQQGLTEFCSAPVRAWDALICTSQASQQVVQGFLDRQEAYLRWRHGAQRFERPLLPVIPLGIHPAQWQPRNGLNRSEIRREARHQLCLPQDATLVLVAGRLDNMTKFQPDSLLRVLEHLRNDGNNQLELVVYGEAFDEAELQRWKNGAQQLAPNLPIHWIPGRKSDLAAPVRWASDLFVSLPDNPQETFGITPLEAMAAGLTCVVSDWDGYRDTVVNPGEAEEPTGVRIPTRMQEGLGTQEALASLNEVIGERMAQGRVSQGIAVDPEALRQTLKELIHAPARREAMGAAGRERVLRYYDWKILIETWRELVLELTQRRLQAVEKGWTLKPQLPPWRPNTSTAFGCYASEVLDRNWEPIPPPEALEKERLQNPFQTWDKDLLRSESPRRRGWWLKQGLVKP
uniref:glycosyltransferase family 4 protein n=1 Tax=Synechococcus sp. UW106 TaxID=368495 RepID=UPI000E0FE8CA|nr:glycosyltransferase family 4 protein [Synechococcus sp. UW106]